MFSATVSICSLSTEYSDRSQLFWILCDKRLEATYVARTPSHIQIETELSQWKVLVVDEDSRKLLDNTVKEDDVLNQNITST